MKRCACLVILATPWATGCARPAPETRQDGAGAKEDAAPAPPADSEATVRRVGARDEVPLRGPRVDAKPGDWLLTGTGGVAVVSASRGAVVDFGAENGDDALVSLDPTVFLGLDQLTSVVESVGPAGAGSHAVLVRKRMLSEPPLRLWTYVTFAGGALRVESVATALEQPALAVTLGEVVAWGNVPTWVEGHGFVHEKGTWSADFIAREGLGVAYALAPEQGHVVARFASPEVGFHEFARTGERLEGVPARGESSRRVILLTQARGPLGEAVRLLPRFAHAPGELRAIPAGLPPSAEAEVARCDGGPFARFAAVAPGLSLPAGDCFRVRFLANGYAPGAWLAADAPAAALSDAALPKAGRLRWRVREKGGAADVPLPARLLVRGVAGTPDPDWGDEPSDGASLDVLHADRDGERAIPPGRYHVTITRGFEYTMSETDLTVAAGKTAVAQADLERVVDTRGWIAADLHVHAVPSMDAPAPLPDRVRALAAAGVEVAVATDHNVLTDYGPALRERGLTRWLASIVGDEATTRGVPMGHFNVFPLIAGGAPVAYERVTATALAAAARAAPPAGAKVVQLNHPRMGGIGYFELSRFDPRDVAGWRARSPLDEAGFDAVEVYNGDDYAHQEEVERVLVDWYALLDAGLHVTATGNSDSHKITYHECGLPRNLVKIDDDDPAHFNEAHDATEARFVEAVRRGRVVVSGGPFVQLDVGGHGVGDSAPPGEEEVHVTVDAPPWMDVSRVELVKRGRTLQAWTGPFASGVRRLDARVQATLAKGDWIVALVRGDRPMTFFHRAAGARPFALTNPVWIE